MQLYNHVMIDLETLGTKSNSVILSIGAVAFNLETGETGPEFFCNVDIQSQLDLGAKVQGQTILWWLGQSEIARKTLTENESVRISQALTQLEDFLEGLEAGEARVHLWGNSARFDLGLLSDACSLCKRDIFWDFRKERCYRTKLAEMPDVITLFPNTAQHTSIGDCHNQIKRLAYVHNFFNADPVNSIAA